MGFKDLVYDIHDNLHYRKYYFYIFDTMNKPSLHYIFFILVISLIFSGCLSTRIRIDGKKPNRYIENSEILGNSFSGFILYDPEKDKIIHDYHGHRFFTPASNTKILTFYTGKKVLGDSIPSLAYAFYQDTLYFTGKGDPTFLHPDFDYQPALNFLCRNELPLAYVPNHFIDKRLGPGWAWDDYPFVYSSEKSAFPLYGNVVWIDKRPMDSAFQILPNIFKDQFEIFRDTIYLLDSGEIKIDREEFNNQFSILCQEIPDSLEEVVPFIHTDTLVKLLLEDTLRKKIFLKNQFPDVRKNIIYSQPTDSLLKPMMIESDNFFAEQILLMCSNVLFDSMATEKTINFAESNYFSDCSEEMYWVDGSGLSRYNQFTPHAILHVLKKIYLENEKKYISDIFPIGGISGTMKNNFNDLNSFVIAKTGSMSHVYNLSGYLITQKGKWMIFSFMNNNFTRPSSEIRKEIEKILLLIKNKY